MFIATHWTPCLHYNYFQLLGCIFHYLSAQAACGRKNTCAPLAKKHCFCKGVINHGQQCGKLWAEAMLVQPGLPCLPVKGVTWLTLGEINMGQVSFLVFSSAPFGKLTMLDRGEEKQMLLRASPPFQFSGAQRFMHTLLFVCSVGEHRAHCVSTAIYHTCQSSLYWLSLSIPSKRSQRIKIALRCSKVWPSTLSRQEAGETNIRVRKPATFEW